MTAPVPRPLKAPALPNPTPGSTRFQAMLQGYYDMPGGRELVQAILDRKAAHQNKENPA